MNQHLPQFSLPLDIVKSPVHRRKIGSAWWLYLAMRSLAKPETGKASFRPAALAQFFSVKPEALHSLLGRLRKDRYITYHRDRAKIQVTILHWTPVHHSSRLDHTNDSHEEDSVTRTLAQKIATTLGDPANLSYFEDLIEETPRNIIDRAFRDACAMPKERIRKSRGALFVYLVKKYAKQEIYGA